MDQNSSESMAALYAALAKAQAEFKVAAFDKKSNYGKYASFKAIREASVESLGKHGLSVIQPVEFDGTHYTLFTVLNHSSGGSIRSSIRLILDRQNMQGLGSAVTYAKRYALASLIGVVSDDDDDANAAVGSPHQPPSDIKPKPKPAPAPAKAAPPAKPAPQNHAPADDSQLMRLDNLMAEKGISEESMTYLLQQGFKTTAKHIPQPILTEIIAFLEKPLATDAAITGWAQELINNQAEPIDTLDKISPMGIETTGKRFSEIKESKLIEMILWSRKVLKERPTRPDAAMIAQFQADATAFLKSMGTVI